MNTLDQIIKSVADHGSHEVRIDALTNAYFQGDGGFSQIVEWAKSVGLTVSFNTQYQVCTFRARQAQST